MQMIIENQWFNQMNFLIADSKKFIYSYKFIL